MRKKLVIWLFVHFFVYRVAADLFRELGASEKDAKFGAHIAGAITGYGLTTRL